VGFVAWERWVAGRGHSPLVDLRLFAVPGYASGATVATLYFCAFTGIFFVLTIYFQRALGYSPLLAGVAVTPFAVGSGVTSFIGGRLVARFGRALVTLGLLLVVAGLAATDVVLVIAKGPATGWYTAAPLLLAGIGSGTVISPNITLTLADVPVPRAGTAGGVLQTGQRIGTAAGIALVGTVFFNELSARAPHGAAAVALGVATALTILALLASAVDLRGRRRRDRGPGLSRSAAPPGRG
jgi:MFS family permease